MGITPTSTLSVRLLKFVCCLSPPKLHTLRYFTGMFSFYADSEMITEKVGGKKERRRCHCFPLNFLLSSWDVLSCFTSQFFAILSVTQCPWIHGSTITTLLASLVVIDPWFRSSIAVDLNGPCLVIVQCNRLFGGNGLIGRVVVKLTIQWKKSYDNSWHV